jgi:hypothetical protein
VDDLELGRHLSRIGDELRQVVRVFIEVDLAGEKTKQGLAEAQLLPTLTAWRGLPSLGVDGLMVLPPFEEDAERSRPYFRRLRELRDEALAAGVLQGRGLSMGMSHDFEIAIEEGATLVRVGSAIFGERAAR